MQQAGILGVTRRWGDDFRSRKNCQVHEEEPRQPQLGLWGGDGRWPHRHHPRRHRSEPQALKILQSAVAPSSRDMKEARSTIGCAGPVRPPLHRRDREGRSLVRIDPALCGAPAWITQPVKGPVKIGYEQFQVLLIWSVANWKPVTLASEHTHGRISTTRSADARPGFW